MFGNKNVHVLSSNVIANKEVYIHFAQSKKWLFKDIQIEINIFV